MAKLDLKYDILLCESFICEALIMNFKEVVLEDIPSKLNNDDKQKFQELIENKNKVEIRPQDIDTILRWNFNFDEVLRKYLTSEYYSTFEGNNFQIPWHSFYRENDNKYIPLDYSANYVEHRKKNYKYTRGLLNAGNVDFTKECLFALHKNNNNYYLFVKGRGHEEKKYIERLNKMIEYFQTNKAIFNIDFDYHNGYTTVNKQKKTVNVGTGRYIVDGSNSHTNLYISEETKTKEIYENIYEDHGPYAKVNVPHRLRNITDEEKALFECVLKNQEAIIDLYDKYEHLGIFSSEKKLITDEINNYLKFNYYAIIKYFFDRVSKDINGNAIINLTNDIDNLKEKNRQLEEEYNKYAITCFKQRKQIKEDIKLNNNQIKTNEEGIKWLKEEESLLLNDLNAFENKCKEILKL